MKTTSLAFLIVKAPGEISQCWYDGTASLAAFLLHLEQLPLSLEWKVASGNYNPASINISCYFKENFIGHVYRGLHKKS